jgi:hypothetical protein
MATKILPSADNTDQLGQSTGNGDASDLRWKGVFTDLRVEGNLTVDGTTTTIETTNTQVADALIELNTGLSGENSNDSGIIIERGTTGNNAAIVWDESADRFVMGTTTATGASSGDLAVTKGTLEADIVGLTSADSPQFTGIELGHASDTTITRPSAGDISVEGNIVYRAGGTDVAVADGGTGASNASDARDNLGLTIGTDVQAYDAQLADVAGLTPTDGHIIIGDGSNFVTEDGATARASLGLTIGTDVQAYDAQLADIAGLSPTDGNIIIGDGSNFVLESGATARTSLGVGTGDSPQFTGIELGHASDTTITRSAEGDIAIEGNIVYRAGGTDVAVADGGTGASNASDARDNLGLTIGTDVQAYDAQLADVAGLTPTDGHIIIGDGSNFVTEDGATARASLGLTIGTDVQAYDAQLADIAGLSPTDGNIIIGDGSNFVLESGATARTSLGVGTGDRSSLVLSWATQVTLLSPAPLRATSLSKVTLSTDLAAQMWLSQTVVPEQATLVMLGITWA